MKKNSKKQTLAMKMVRKISPVLIICFTVLIAAVAIFSFQTMSSIIKREFNSIADGNASRIQSAMDEAELVAKNIQTYLVREYDLDASMTAEEKAAGAGKSVVTGAEMHGLNVRVEDFMIKESWGAILNSDNIMGIGANFEPYKYDSNIRSYAYYINEENAQAEEAPFLGEYEEYCNEIYYQQAKETLKPIFTEPYEFDGIKRIICSFPIVYQNEFQGIITANIRLDRFQDLVKINKTYSSMYSSILTQDGIFVYDSDSEEYANSSLFDMLDEKSGEKVKEGMAGGESFSCVVRDEGSQARYFLVPVKAGANTWWSLTSVEIKDMNWEVLVTVFTMVVIALFILILINVIITRFLHKMLFPLKGIVKAADQIKEGKLDVELKSESNDEIGQLTDSFSQMAFNLKMVIEETSEDLGKMADGNFAVTTAHPEYFVGEYSDILSATNNINRKLSEALNQINDSADQVASGSNQVAGASQVLSEGAADQASSIEELSATVTDISSHVQDNAENARAVSQKADIVGKHAEESSQKMTDMLSAISAITESSREIEKIIHTIEDIAAQTNLLSLNAAIEAARAGDAGRGFAVVADEVRELAGKSAEASQNTSVLIQSALQAVENGTRIADETANALGEVVEGVEEIIGNISQISQASNQQANSLSQVTEGIDQISGVVQNNSATAQESAAASEELSSQSQLLKELVGRFQLENKK